jgi:hypothetical protein
VDCGGCQDEKVLARIAMQVQLPSSARQFYFKTILAVLPCNQYAPFQGVLVSPLGCNQNHAVSYPS